MEIRGSITKRRVLKMRLLKRKILALVLSFVLVGGMLVSTEVEASEENAINQSVVEATSEIVGERSDIVYLEGKPGDTHLVYTYVQNGKTYKVVEDADEDFCNVTSTFYELKDNDNFVKNSTQYMVKGDDSAIVTFKDKGDNTYNQFTLDLEIPESNYSKPFIQNNSEWVTEYIDGKKIGLQGLGITLIIGALSSIATACTSSIAANVAVNLVANIAQRLFSSNAEVTYYHAIYNWRHSPKNALVTDEAQTTWFYLDSQHTYPIGNQVYVEYIF